MFQPMRSTISLSMRWTQPVTIHKNESAMVPILQQELPTEHVTLWSEKVRRAAAGGVAGEQVEADAGLGEFLDF